MIPLGYYAASGLVNFITAFSLGSLLLFKNRKTPTSRIFAVFSLTVAFWSFFYFLWLISTEKERAEFFLRTCMIGVLWMPSLFLDFAYAFLSIKRTKFIWFNYLFSLVSSSLVYTKLYARGVEPFLVFPYWATPGLLFHAALFHFGAVVSYAFFLMWKSLIGGSTGLFRNQLKYVFVGTAIGYVCGATNYFPWYRIPLPPVLNVFISLYVASIAFAIVRYRLMDINLAITRTAVFAVVYAVVLGVPLWVALAWQEQLRALFGSQWWVSLWIACAALSTAAHYANLYFQRRAEGRLLAEQRRYQTALRQASQGMTLIKELNRLLSLIVHLLTQKVRLKHAAIYLWDKQTERFTMRATRQCPEGKPAPVFTLSDPLLDYLSWHRGALVTEELVLQKQGAQAELQPVIDQLKALDAAVLVPSFVEDQCLGFLVLGEKKSRALYSPDDLQVFQVLANQAALAIENAQFYEDLKSTQAELFQTAKLASLGQMAGGMSHQINNRFYVLSILAGTLKATMKELDPAVAEPAKLRELWQRIQETLTKVEQNAIRGGDIVKTLLKFSRPGSLETKPITLQEIVATARDVAQYKIDFTVIDFVQEWPEDLPPVSGNLNQLADCFFNLITNAYDAIQSKAEKISPPDFRGKITVSGHLPVAGFVSVDVSDNGIGMTKQDMDQIFVPFFTTKATAEKGTGLGLFVIKRILEHHGGNIEAQSAPGQGTAFTLTLPVAEAKQAVA